MASALVVVTDVRERGAGIPSRAHRIDGDSNNIFRVQLDCRIGCLGIIGGAIPCAKN